MRGNLGVVSGRFFAASLLAVALVALSPRVAHADDDRLKFLAEQMKDADSRVRTSAALALGSTNTDGAVEPLCGGLDDKEDVVRQAAAVALKRLNRTRSLPCLKSHETTEQNEAAKIAISRAIEAISAGGEGGGGGGSEPVKENPNAKYYIAVATSVGNETGRANGEIEKIILKAIRSKLEANGDVQLAPVNENGDHAKEVIAKRKLKGLYLQISVPKFQYADGNLKVTLRLGVCQYPKINLIGSYDKGVTGQGITEPDHAAEDRLLDIAAGLAGEQFAQKAAAFL